MPPQCGNMGGATGSQPVVVLQGIPTIGVGDFLIV